MKKRPLYHYRAKVTSVYDGDTCTVDIDLGMGVWARKEKIGLLRINAPEIRGEEREAGLMSRDYLRRLILRKTILLQTVKDRKGKYGRYLGEIWVERRKRWINVNDRLVKKSYAEYNGVLGGGSRPERWNKSCQVENCSSPAFLNLSGFFLYGNCCVVPNSDG